MKNTEERREQFSTVTKELEKLFVKKNTDYADSFAEHGPVGVLLRIHDKLKRFFSVTKNGINLVEDETLRDTLRDNANYSIMAIMLLDEE